MPSCRPRAADTRPRAHGLAEQHLSAVIGAAAVRACSRGGVRLACRRALRVGGKERRMGRRAKPAKVKAQAKRPLVRKSLKDEGAKVRDLEKRLAEALTLKAEALKREAEALEQQRATSEILRVIGSSPTDEQ